MKIFLDPTLPLNNDFKYFYTFEEGYIKVISTGGIEDVFDFREFSDGELKVRDADGNIIVKSTLNPQPVLHAEKRDGELYVTLTNFIGADATEEERFPKWIDHTEYVQPTVKPKEDSEEAV